MEDKKEEDKYMLDTNTEFSEQKISVATWVMIAWIILFFVAGGIAIWCSVK